MEQAQVTAAFPARRRAAFREIAAELIAAVRAREPDTLQYLWYFSEDGARCSAREICRDSDAVLHISATAPSPCRGSCRSAARRSRSTAHVG